MLVVLSFKCSNNTNKLSPQEQLWRKDQRLNVQIIQINLVLKNCRPYYNIFMLYLQYILSISIIECQIKSCVFIFKLLH